jgi:hypothetical protein
MLGGIIESAIEHSAGRAFFWQRAMQQLDQLANRVLTDDRERIEAALAEKVPRLTRKEYDAWLVEREGMRFGPFGKAPSFEICGKITPP